jgi:8-oxo-dGTP pyrophosphatase MutT (NUDIX family)
MSTLTREDISGTVDRYLERHPDERRHLGPLLHALQVGADVTSRREFNGGHVTCGAVVIGDDGRLLLVRHKTLDAWLLPGGHVEPGDGELIYAALRELEEETGISWHGTVSPPGQDVLPIDIDLHHIPANPAKGEPAHWHADFRYAFWVKEPVVRLQPDEVDGYAWRPRTDAPTPKLTQKITHL